MAKRLSIGLAVEDEQYRNLLRGQSRLGGSPIEYVDYSAKEPWSSSWKTNCRQRIRGCAGMIALLSTNTRAAEGARWEIRCADEEDVPILGVYIHSEASKRYTPPEIQGHNVISWSWDGIADFIRRLP